MKQQVPVSTLIFGLEGLYESSLECNSGHYLLFAASAVQAEDRVVQRRLNRIEYENTLNDLFQTNVSVKEMLPEDAISQGVRQCRRGVECVAGADRKISGSRRRSDRCGD